jgi:hypothetical protein
MLVPRLIAGAGENASLRFLDFFTANIRNPNTRAAYAVAVHAFFSWVDAKHVAARGGAHPSRLRLRRIFGPPLSRADRQAAPRGGNFH